MACDEQKRLAATIKKIHSDLRSQCAELGINEAWKNHLENESTLKLYANSMSQLAEKYWTSNSTGEDRINWVASFCLKYFYSEEIKKWRLKEIRTIEALREQGIEISADLATTMEVGEKLEILDVGSSGNFFRKFDQFNLLPIDIAPSDDSVVYCDFLSVPIENSIQRDDKTIEALPANHFHAVVFSLLLEYLPTSEQRIRCCEKAYQVLRQEGILLIVTPDSNHETKNSKLIKNWRWTLAKIGFNRVKVNKLKNLTCMAFRKSFTSVHWAETHREAYMEFKIEIPQDRSKLRNNVEEDSQ